MTYVHALVLCFKLGRAVSARSSYDICMFRELPMDFGCVSGALGCTCRCALTVLRSHRNCETPSLNRTHCTSMDVQLQ